MRKSQNSDGRTPCYTAKKVLIWPSGAAYLPAARGAEPGAAPPRRAAVRRLRAAARAGAERQPHRGAARQRENGIVFIEQRATLCFKSFGESCYFQ